MNVLLPCGKSPKVQLLRGVRQGCPMSPVLFDIFINDIFRHCADLGVSVPGLDHKVPGLMFADDIVLLSSTSDGLTSMLNTAQDWANKWEMRFGVSKCGITVFNHDIETLRERDWILNDELVPVVDRYTYLGIEVHSSLDINEVVKARKTKALKALMAMQPFLMTRSIPMVIRVRALRTLVYPVAMYGGELFGMNKVRSKELERVVNMGLKWCSNLSGNSTLTSVETLRREWNIPPVYASAAAMRARAWLKYPSLRTWIRDIVTTRAGSSWSSVAKGWLTRCGGDGWKLENLSIDDKRKVILEQAWSATESRESASGKRYREGLLELSREYLKISILKYPHVLPGIEWLLRVRTGSYLTAHRMVLFGKLQADLNSRCPLCLEEVRETPMHIMLKCTAHLTEREEHLLPIVRRITRCGIPITDELKALMLLGGEPRGFTIPKWDWLGTQDHDNVGVTPPFVWVSMYLHAVMPKRLQSLMHLCKQYPPGEDSESTNIDQGPYSATGKVETSQWDQPPPSDQ